MSSSRNAVPVWKQIADQKLATRRKARRLLRQEGFSSDAADRVVAGKGFGVCYVSTKTRSALRRKVGIQLVPQRARRAR